MMYSCSNIDNALAVSYKGNRYILYDNKFMDNIANKTNYWSNIFILAHEVGHRMNGHSVDVLLHLSNSVKQISLSESRQQELEADEFAGFILAKLGSSLSQTSAAINLIANDEDDSNSTHPSKAKRLAAIKTGFIKGTNNKNNYDKNSNLNKAEEYIYRGLEKENLQDYNGAIVDYSIAIELNPNSFNAYLNRGGAKGELGDHKRALVDFSKSIELNQNNSYAYMGRGISKSHLNDSGAMADLSKAIELNPTNNDAYSNRGNAKARIKDYSGALNDYNKAVEINPNDGVNYFNRGLTKIELKDYSGAIVDYSKAIELNPNYARAYYLRGNSKFILEQKDSACLDWSKAFELGDKYAYNRIKESCN